MAIDLDDRALISTIGPLVETIVRPVAENKPEGKSILAATTMVLVAASTTEVLMTTACEKEGFPNDMIGAVLGPRRRNKLPFASKLD